MRWTGYGKFKKLIKILLPVAGASALYTLYDKKHFIIKRYSLESEKINKPIKIVVLSDLHSQEYGKDNSRLFSAVKKQNPDLIILAGDMVSYKDDEKEIKKLKRFCENLTKISDVCYTFGNHEYVSKRKSELESLKTCGVKIMNKGEPRTIRLKNKQVINICGIDDQIHKDLDLFIAKKKQIRKRFNNNNNNLNIFIYHYPKEAAVKFYDLNADLIISGHAHGGQWRIGFGDKSFGLYSPEEGIFPKYTNGIFNLKHATLIISRGIGSWTWIPRINNPAEIVVLTINRKEKK